MEYLNQRVVAMQIQAVNQKLIQERKKNKKFFTVNQIKAIKNTAL